ncbi:MAG: hypothetical protein ACYDB7_07330 [Mycobacteriales bacterium]
MPRHRKEAAAAAEAARRGLSKAAHIRECLAAAIGCADRADQPSPPREEMIGWLDDEPVTDIDEVLHGPKS